MMSRDQFEAIRRAVGAVVAEVRSGADSALRSYPLAEVMASGPSSPDYGRGWHDGYQQGWSSAATLATITAAQATADLLMPADQPAPGDAQADGL